MTSLCSLSTTTETASEKKRRQQTSGGLLTGSLKEAVKPWQTKEAL